MVSELEKYVYEKYQKFIKNQGVLGVHFKGLSFITLFSYRHGGIRSSQVEIKFGKNSKAKHIHAY